MAETIIELDGFAVFGHNSRKILAVKGITYQVNGSRAQWSNVADVIDYISGAEGLGEWEEIPILKPNVRGLLQATVKGFEQLPIRSPYLYIGKNDEDVNELCAKASDRYERYLNHRLYAVIEGEEYEVWCIADWNNIIDNTTVVYEDEECTIPIGVISNHNYNPNNPYDTEIVIDGDNFVFTWDTKDYPEALATTLAVIECGEKKKGKLAGNAVYFKANGTGSWVQVSVNWVTDHYECTPATNPGFIVVITTDGNAPENDFSNACNIYQWTAGSTFGIIAVADFTSDAHGDAPIQISL